MSSLKKLAKNLARFNGGDLQKAMQILEQRKRDIEKHNFEYVFKRNKKYEEVKENENNKG